jgi:hypothetical protein
VLAQEREGFHLMAKQGQHKNDANDKRISKGHNNLSKSQPITTGTYKKPETYQKQAAEHSDPGRHAPAAKNEWNADTRDFPTKEEAHEARRPSRRPGSKSNESRRTRGY